MTKRLKSEEGRRPTAVLISDIHFSLSSLYLADAALRQAIDKAASLNVPLIVAGDLHDTKANLRGECVKALLDIFEALATPTYLLVGNHDLFNEKGEGNSLEFLRDYCGIIDAPLCAAGFHFIPYQHDPAEFERILGTIPQGSIVICHQGVTSADMGEYVHDKSAVNKDILAPYRVISGHYHKAQDIKCGKPQKGAVGLMSYIGSPYTITFSEANDGPKGFQVLYSDGLMEQVPTNLRKHVIVEAVLSEGHLHVTPVKSKINTGDLVWAKVKGTSLELDKLKKSEVAKMIGVDHNNFKLDKIVTDAPVENVFTEKMANSEIIDALIDQSNESAAKKAELKALWRTL